MPELRYRSIKPQDFRPDCGRDFGASDASTGLSLAIDACNLEASTNGGAILDLQDKTHYKVFSSLPPINRLVHVRGRNGTGRGGTMIDIATTFSGAYVFAVDETWMGLETGFEPASTFQALTGMRAGVVFEGIHFRGDRSGNSVSAILCRGRNDFLLFRDLMFQHIKGTCLGVSGYPLSGTKWVDAVSHARESRGDNIHMRNCGDTDKPPFVLSCDGYRLGDDATNNHFFSRVLITDSHVNAIELDSRMHTGALGGLRNITFFGMMLEGSRNPDANKGLITVLGRQDRLWFQGHMTGGGATGMVIEQDVNAQKTSGITSFMTWDSIGIGVNVKAGGNSKYYVPLAQATTTDMIFGANVTAPIEVFPYGTSANFAITNTVHENAEKHVTIHTPAKNYLTADLPSAALFPNANVTVLDGSVNGGPVPAYARGGVWIKVNEEPSLRMQNLAKLRDAAQRALIVNPQDRRDLVTQTFAPDRLLRVRCAATGNVAIATALENGDSLDGCTLLTGDVVFLPLQTAPAEIGPYVVVASGAASRHTDYDAWNDFLGLTVLVQSGTANGGKAYRSEVVSGGTIGTTPIAFAEKQWPFSATARLTPDAALTNQVFIKDTPSSYRINGGIAAYRDTSSGDALKETYIIATDYAPTNSPLVSIITANPGYQQIAGSYEFMTAADVLEFRIRENTAAPLKIMVDDQYIDYEGHMIRGFPTIYVRINCGSSRMRKFKVEVQGTHAALSVSVAPTFDVRAPIDDSISYYFNGDSFVEGGSGDKRDSMFARLGRRLGASNAVQLAQPAAGYVVSGGKKTAINFFPFWSGRAAPECIVIAHSYNDTGSAATTATAAATFWAAVRAAFPNALIVVMGTWCPPAQVLATLQAREDAIKAAFVTWNDKFSAFIPVANGAVGPWSAGSGNVGSPSGTGTNDIYILADNVHLTVPIGQDAYARLAEAGVRQILKSDTFPVVLA